MNIVFFTNTYLPHVGGVARSVDTVSQTLRKQGHRVLIVAPEFPDMPDREEDVIRIPALQKFNASDFSVALPFPKGLNDRLGDFEPDVIHSHHPFLLGTTAIRVARLLQVPLVFTHHTLYEEYTHYVVPDNPRIKRFISEIATGYANLCDRVVAPSESIRKLIRDRGVEPPIEVIPTGVDTEIFQPGPARAFRRRLGISDDAYVVGHLGRLAPEKNMTFLARSVCEFMKKHPRAVFLVVGDGPSKADINDVFHREQMQERLFMPGTLSGAELVNALRVMEVFAFASKSETQGMVINEAMATGVPVVALDAFGVGDLVDDGENGRKLERESVEAFCAALDWVCGLPPEESRRVRRNARRCAEAYSLDKTAETLAGLYRTATKEFEPYVDIDSPIGLETLMARLRTEWEIIKKISQASDEALSGRAAE